MIALVMLGSIVFALWPQDRLSNFNTDSALERQSGGPSKRHAMRDEVWLLLSPVGLFLALRAPVSGILVAACGPALWWFRGRQRLARDQRAKRDALPEVLDLVAMAVGAGLTVSSAMQLARDEGPDAVRLAFGSVLARSDAGLPLARALPNLFDDLGESYDQLVTALVSSVRDGAPLADLLARLGDNARMSRRRRAEERGRRLPVVMMFPLSVCSMPAVLIGTIVPVAIVGFRSASI